MTPDTAPPPADVDASHPPDATAPSQHGDHDRKDANRDGDSAGATPAPSGKAAAGREAGRDAGNPENGADDRTARLSEATLVGRAQEGDLAAFETLMRRYQTPVFRLAQRMLADRSDAEDVVQDTFVLVWRRLPTLVDPALFHGWVYQIVTRRCLNVIRARTRRASTPTEARDLEPAQPAGPDASSTGGGSDPATAAVMAAQLDDLERALQALPDEQRACWVLREMHELSYPEIAYATRLPVSTVRGRIARARQNLVKGMASWR